MTEIRNIRANSSLDFLKHLHAIDPSFVTITKPLSNKIGGTFCEGLKYMCKFFEKNGNLSISQNPLTILL